MAIETVVLDIEGTTSSTWFVHKTLYPYSRERFATWIAAHWERPDVQRQVGLVRELAGEPDADLDGVVHALYRWLDADQKVTPLKAFQGWIWDEGFASGDLTSHFFDDAIPAMQAWHAEGKRLVIFSSGSLSAQHAWFGNTPAGSLLPLISAHFDTENAGPKRMEESYRKIAAELGAEPSTLVFLSDLVASSTVPGRPGGTPSACGARATSTSTRVWATTWPSRRSRSWISRATRRGWSERRSPALPSGGPFRLPA
jgi:enolase-phosphatase E1